MTARWVVEEVAPARDLTVTWQPISLFVKNEPAEGTKGHEPLLQTHRYLRVMESVRSSEGEQAVFDLYWELGRRIHHDRSVVFDVADALAAAGLSTEHAAAFDEESWDGEIRSRMDAGLALVGDDVGTPIIAFDGGDGSKTAIFGPVITRVPRGDDALTLWDSVRTLTALPGFWELKRTRTEGPEVGERPG